MKLIELYEGKLKNLQIDSEFDKRKPMRDEFGIMINGKMWKKDGKPVRFRDVTSALKAADKITATRNITTQVLPLKK